MTGIDFEAIRGRSDIEIPVIAGMESSIDHVAASYGSLADSLREISDITRLPAFVLPGTTCEIYTTSFALETLHSWDDRDEDEAKRNFSLSPKQSWKHRDASLFCSRSIRGSLGYTSAIGMPCMVIMPTEQGTF